MNRPHGIYPMLYAFFHEDGALDREAMRRQVNAMIAAGAHGIAILGLITEVEKLEAAERRHLVEWCVEDIGGRVPLAVTVAGETTGEQIDFALFAASSGANWLVLQPPRTTRPSETELLKFYDTIMTKLTLPVGIQNAPEYLGVGLKPSSVAELQSHNSHFTVMKGEGPVYQVRRFIDSTQGTLAIFNGRGGLELPDNLKAGCAGMIPAPDCADIQVKIYNHLAAGEIEEAEALYEDVLPLIVFTMQSIEFAVSYGKMLTSWRLGGDIDASARPPHLEPDSFGSALTKHHARRLPARFLS